MKFNKDLLTLLLFPLLFVVFVSVGYDFNGLYGQDGHAIFQYARSLKAFWAGEIAQTTVLMWPVNYPVLGVLLSYVGIPLAFSLQLISALSAVGVLFFTYLIIHQLFKLRQKRMINFTFLMLGLSPIFLRTSVMVMSEMTTLFFLSGFWFFVIRFIKAQKSPDLLIGALLAGLAIGTRYAAAALIIPLAFWGAFTAIKHKKYVAFVSSIFIGLIGFLPTLFIKGGSTFNFISHDWWLTGWNPLHFFQRTFETTDGKMSFLLPNFLYLFQLFVHPIFFFLGLVLVYFLKKNLLSNKLINALVITLSFYLIFLMGLPFQNKRFLFLALPLAGVLFFLPYQYFMRVISLRLNIQMAFSIFLVFIQLGLFSYSFLSFLNRNRLERQIAASVERYPENRVYGFDMDISLKSYNSNKQVFNLWEKEYPTFRHNSLVIFNEDKFREQWDGKNPMLNWNKMQKEYSVILKKEFSKGWALYEIQ